MVKRLSIFGLVGAVFALVLVPVLQVTTTTVHAATDGIAYRINQNELQVDNVIYTACTATQPTNNCGDFGTNPTAYYASSWTTMFKKTPTDQNFCDSPQLQANIGLGFLGVSSNGKLALLYSVTSPGQGGCAAQTRTYTIQDASNGAGNQLPTLNGKFISSDIIQIGSTDYTDGSATGAAYYTPDGTGPGSPGGNGCEKDVVQDISTDGKTAALYSISPEQGTGNCTLTKAAIVKLDVTNLQQSSTAANAPSCENSGFSLSWFMCKVIDGLADAVNGIYSGLIEPMLVTPGIAPTNRSGTSLQSAWSSFRVIADVLLVIALLVVVFGESIGGGMIDAYTVKKVLPRILIAAVLINLSYYLMEIAIDISNILGKGIGELITVPFHLQSGAGYFHFDLGNQGAVSQGSSLIAFGGAAGAAGIGAAFGIGAATTAGLGATLEFLFFFVLLPLILIILAVAATLIIRIGLMYALVLAAPLAFAAYVLPNTEKYFKKWWELTQEVLLIYPLVAVMFALSAVLAQTTLWGNGSGGGLRQVFGFVTSLILLAIPLAAIPFAFKIAGGLLGRVHELIHSGGQRARGMLNGNDKDPNSRRNRSRTKMQLANIQNRQDRYQDLQSRIGSSNSRVGRWALKRRASVLGGYNIEAAASAARAQVGKEVNDQIATGADAEVRGLTVNKRTSRSRLNEKTNTVEWETLGGAWVSEADVDAGHARWGNNTFAQQAALAYEMRKAQSEDQLQRLSENYGKVAQGPGGWGMTDQQAGGAWIGAAFEHQNAHLENKYTDWQTGKLKMDGNGLMGTGFIDEAYEKKGSYPLAQMGSNTIEQMKLAYKQADTVANSANSSAEAKKAAVDQMQKIAAISETFMHQLGSVGGDEAEVAARQAAAAAGDRSPVRQASTTGAAHVSERVRELAVMTGVYASAPTGVYGPGHQPQTRSENRREQS